MKALQDLSDRIHRADSLERLLDSILEGLEESFGFAHSMILVPTDEEGVFVTIASRGYPENGVGAEARIGEGIIGMVAEARKPIRISGLIRQCCTRYAVQKRAQEAGHLLARSPDSASRASQPDSQLGVPLLVRRRTRRRAVHRKRASRTAFTRKTRRRSSCSAATWRSPFRTCSCSERSEAAAAGGARSAAHQSAPRRPRLPATPKPACQPPRGGLLHAR